MMFRQGKDIDDYLFEERRADTICKTIFGLIVLGILVVVARSFYEPFAALLERLSLL